MDTSAGISFVLLAETGENYKASKRKNKIMTKSIFPFTGFLIFSPLWRNFYLHAKYSLHQLIIDNYTTLTGIPMKVRIGKIDNTYIPRQTKNSFFEHFI